MSSWIGNSILPFSQHTRCSICHHESSEPWETKLANPKLTLSTWEAHFCFLLRPTKVVNFLRFLYEQHFFACCIYIPWVYLCKHMSYAFVLVCRCAHMFACLEVLRQWGFLTELKAHQVDNTSWPASSRYLSMLPHMTLCMCTKNLSLNAGLQVYTVSTLATEASPQAKEISTLLA